MKISQPLSNELIVGFSQNVPRELAGRARTVPQVGADAERTARAGDDRDPRVLVVAEARERVVEAAAHLAVDRVQRFRPVVRDRRDVIGALVFDRIAGNDDGMLDHLSIQCDDLEVSGRFYDTVLATIGGQRVLEFGPVIGYGVDFPGLLDRAGHDR